MKTKLLSALLSLCLVLGLVACGGAGGWQTQYDLGVRYLSEGNYEEAIIAFTAAIEIDPRQADAFVGRADAYIGSGETEENLSAALADYEQAATLDETNPNAWLGMADVYIRRGEYDKAAEVLQQGLEKTGSEDIADKLAEIEAGNISDSEGKIRQMSHYDPDGTLIWYHIHTYNEKGQKASVTSFDGTGKQTGYVPIIWDEQGHDTQSFWYYEDTGEIGRLLREYDSNGNLVKQTPCNLDGAPGVYTTFEYDSNGNVIRENNYLPDGTLSYYCLTEYDAAGRMTRETSYEADGTIMDYYTYEHDAAGRTVRRSCYEPDGTIAEYTVFEYDNDGNRTRETNYDGNGNMLSVTTY